MSYSKHGGARIGAGRPRKRDAGISHAKRSELAGPGPVHVSIRVLEHVYNLRTRRCFEAIFAAFVACCSQEGFRVVGLTVQGHHLHLLVEAANADALARGMLTITIRLAKGLNRVMGRHGPVLERYHAEPLENPTRVRATIRYILGNTAKHAAQVGRRLPRDYRDPYTVGFFGDLVLRPEGTAGMVTRPESWLLCEGWKRAVVPGRSALPDVAPRRRPGAPAPVAERDQLSLFASAPRGPTHLVPAPVVVPEPATPTTLATAARPASAAEHAAPRLPFAA